MATRLIITGSPHKAGRSARLAKGIAARYREEYPADAVELFTLYNHTIGPCIACDGCKDEFRCVIDDDMQGLYPLLDAADELTIVSPVFFAGPPSQYKALLDRLQAYFWKSVRQKKQDPGNRPPKRPAVLYVVGEGGDPHGFEPLVVTTRSALAVAGFRLGDIYDCVQRNGEELDDAAAHPERYVYKGPRCGG